MAEVQRRWDPKSLYSFCIDIMAKNFKTLKKEIRCLTANILFDIYFKLYKKNKLCVLGDEFSSLENFRRLLKLSKCRLSLHECFQTLEEHGEGVAKALTTSYVSNAKKYLSCPCVKSRISVIDTGLRLGSFLFDAAWFDKAEKVFLSCKELCESLGSTPENKILLLQCCHNSATDIDSVGKRNSQIRESLESSETGSVTLTPKVAYHFGDESVDRASVLCGVFHYTEGARWATVWAEVFQWRRLVDIYLSKLEWHLRFPYWEGLLRVQAIFCNLVGAQETYHQTLVLIEDLKRCNRAPHLAGIYADFSYYFFTKNEFDDAHRYSKAALQKLKTEKTSTCSRPSRVPLKTVVEVLRQASRSCVVKREFTKAGLLVRQAVDLAAEVFGTDHPKYADALLDYGFFLLYYDSIQQCVEVYEKAYQIKTSVFKKDNIHVALALEDLAYGLYVREYSSGRFQVAKEKSEESIRIMEKLLPVDHFMLSSAKRVKALILEEIAIDNANEHSRLLDDAEKLHLSALNISIKAFGDKNVQTAKHYGNLGRLYQSMKKYHQAEEMHLKAIAIKEELLGPDDYEVGLSVGHLASLYNYHMKEFSKAIDLYLRSISINLKLFGKGYSGLEYDYRGMIHLFMNLDDPEKVAEYSFLLNAWKVLREHQLQKNNDALMSRQPPKPIDEILEEVLENGSDPSVSTS